MDRSIGLCEELQSLFPNLLELLALLRAGLAGDPAQGRGIEIVVGKDNVTKAQVIQFVDLLDDLVAQALARLPAIRYPNRTETAVLGAPSHRLDGGKHVLSGSENVPSRHQQSFAGTAYSVLAPRQLAT